MAANNAVSTHLERGGTAEKMKLAFLMQFGGYLTLDRLFDAVQQIFDAHAPLFDALPPLLDAVYRAPSVTAL
ncbi:hypothetical protein [Salipaludibacillus aurantiacus]|uniref:hypothetical protein n=1 Tax=Salipaludibacillus aurantiacus TaxID=1601833 RepID=UPI000B89A988|nr:hypothetical protein [Salipaludibacillus aurantiacus]